MNYSPTKSEAFKIAYEDYEGARESVRWDRPEIEELHAGLSDRPLFAPELLREEPEWSVIMPSDITIDPPELTIHSLKIIQRAAQQSGPVEIWLWANYENDFKTVKGLESLTTFDEYIANSHQIDGYLDMRRNKASTCFNRLIDMLQDTKDLDPELVRVRPCLSDYEKDHTMNHRFSDAVEVYAADAKERDFQNPKFVRLDNDLTFLGPKFFTELSEVYGAHPDKIIKPNLLFTAEAKDSRPFSELDEPSQAAAAYAIWRRAIERSRPFDEHTMYLDECGIAMSLVRWLECGGLLESPEELRSTRRYGHNESAALLRNAKQYHRTHVNYRNSGRHVVEAPRARIGTSYRKMRSLAQTSQTKDMVNGLENTAYRPFLHGDISDVLGTFYARTRFVSAEAMRQLMKTMAAVYRLGGAEGHNRDTEKRRQLLERYYHLGNLLIERCGLRYETESEVEEVREAALQEFRASRV